MAETVDLDSVESCLKFFLASARQSLAVSKMFPTRTCADQYNWHPNQKVTLIP